MLNKIRDIEESLLVDSVPTIEDIKTANRIALESGLVGRPVVSGCVDFIGVYDKEQRTLKEDQEKPTEGLHYGKFLRFYITNQTEICGEYITEQPKPYILFQDFENEKEIYGVPINEVPLISDVMVELEDDPKVEEVETILSNEKPNLIELAKAYQKLQSFDDFYLTQLTAHIQYLLKVGDICSSVVATSETRIYTDERSYQLSRIAPINCAVGNHYLPIVASDDIGSESSLIFYTTGQTTDEYNYSRSIILDSDFNAYCRP